LRFRSFCTKDLELPRNTTRHPLSSLRIFPNKPLKFSEINPQSRRPTTDGWARPSSRGPLLAAAGRNHPPCAGRRRPTRRPASARHEARSSRRSPALQLAAAPLRRRPRAPPALLGSAARKAQGNGERPHEPATAARAPRGLTRRWPDLRPPAPGLLPPDPTGAGEREGERERGGTERGERRSRVGQHGAARRLRPRCRRGRCIQTRIPTTRRRPRNSRSSLQLDSVHVLAGQRLDLAE